MKLNRLRKLTPAITLILPLSFVAIAANQDWKAQVRNQVLPEKRELIAKAQGDLLSDGSDIAVIKIRGRDSMRVEVFKTLSNGSTEKIESLDLPGHRDAHFTVATEASNLAILDINADGKLDVVTSFVDSKLTPRLVAYTWNSISKTFDPVSVVQFQIAQADPY